MNKRDMLNLAENLGKLADECEKMVGVPGGNEGQFWQLMTVWGVFAGLHRVVQETADQMDEATHEAPKTLSS